MISKVRKLKGRSLPELVDRGRQSLGALAERAGASRHLKLPDDSYFCRTFEFMRGEAMDLVDALVTVSKPIFPAFSDLEGTIKACRSRFLGEPSRIVGNADRIASGKFDLLGFNDLSFDGIDPDWHLDPVSGTRFPLVHRSRIPEVDPSTKGDKKIVWELNRHQHFTTLGQAYLLTRDEKYADVFARHVESWIGENPPKIGINWVSSLEIAFRSISWVWAIHFFKGSPVMTRELALMILKSLYLNGRHLQHYLSTYKSPNTHLTGEALGLFIIGSFFDGRGPAAFWEKQGLAILAGALEDHIRPDGGYVEQSTAYHRYTADFYLFLLLIQKTRGRELPHELLSRIGALLDFLVFAQQPDGSTPLIGDDDGGRLHFLDGSKFDDFRPTLALGACLLKKESLKFAAGDATPELLWLCGPTGLDAFDSLGPAKPAATVKLFARSGVFSARTRWSRHASFVYADCGEHGFLNGGHAHADALSFVYSALGRQILIDPGTFVYAADPPTRDEFRTSGAHNCLTVNGSSSSIPAGPFNWETQARCQILEFSDTEETVLLRAAHDGYERFGVGYEREFRLDQVGVLDVTDIIRVDALNRFEINFTLSPELVPEILDYKRVILRSETGNEAVLRVDTILVAKGEAKTIHWRAVETMFSRRYGHKETTVKLVLTVETDRDFKVQNSFTPMGVRQTADVRN